MTDATDDFFAGFNQSATPGSTAPAATPDPAPAAEQNDEHSQQPTDAAGRENDPSYWRARFEQANGQQRKIAQQLKDEADARARAEADAQRARDEANEALRRADETAQLAAQLKPDAGEQPQSDPELDALNEQAPTVMAGVRKLIDRELAPVRKQLTAREQDESARAARIAAQEHANAIAAKHPDWMRVGNSNEFNAYIDRLPPWQRQSALRVKAQGTADEIVSLLDSYKQSGSPPSVPESDPDDMSSVASGAVRPNTGGDPRAMNDDFSAGWTQSVRG
ncbi:MAG: hypothetical protein K2W80_14130 [Burkholderiales bacterium]|nr:hypothetical protein [Burkholderiales bacterium]